MSQPTILPFAPPAPSTAPILDVRDLRVHFEFTHGPLWNRRHGAIRAVDGMSFQVAEGETFGLVGESGSGKSTTARAILGLLPITSGEIWLSRNRIDSLDDRGMLPLRRIVQMIFQDPFASLNPRMTAGRIIGEPLAIFDLLPKADRKLEVMRLMDIVGLDPRLVNRYPHEFSGGQRQRIGIARALAVRPRLIICDEPVSALDVSIQAQVINLLMDLQQQFGLAYVFIAHDLSVVRHISRRIGVMYLGKLVEVADADELFANPRHPYTRALLSAIPIPNPVQERERKRIALVGEIPAPEFERQGCPFADRCPIAELECLQSAPPLAGADHQTACFLAEREGTA